MEGTQHPLSIKGTQFGREICHISYNQHSLLRKPREEMVMMITIHHALDFDVVQQIHHAGEYYLVAQDGLVVDFSDWWLQEPELKTEEEREAIERVGNLWEKRND